VLLGEPERTQADLNFALFGFPVRIHPLFWLVAVILGFRAISTPADLLIWVLAVFLSILVHELGHMAAARLVGVRVLSFSLGLGPPLLSARWRGTELRLCLLPLGGFVGLEELEPRDDEDAGGDGGPRPGRSPHHDGCTVPRKSGHARAGCRPRL